MIPIVRLFAVALACAVPPALAQDAYPDRTVRLVVPFPASGPLDVMARIYAQTLGERWGKPVIVDNRTGATGSIGADAVVKAAPDGYTLLFTVDLPLVMAPNAVKVAYDPRKDLVPVAGLGRTSNMIMVHPSTGAKSLDALVALARTKPGEITFSSAGPGSPAHLCGEMVKKGAGVDMVHVPYKGAAPAMNAVLAGEVKMFCGPIPQGLPHRRAGKVIALAVTGDKPSPLVPDLKPLAETYPGLVVSNWYAVLAPVGTAPAVVKFLRDELKVVYDDAAIRERLAGIGIDAEWSEAGAVSQMIASDLAKWGEVARAAGIKQP